MKRVLLLGLLVLLAACGSKEAKEEEQTPRTLPVEKPFLTLSILSDSTTVARAGRAWSEREGVDLKLLPRGPQQAPPAEVALGERQDDGGRPWLLAPYGLLVRLDLLKDAGQATTPPASWQALAVLVRTMERKGSGLGIPEPSEGLHRLFLPLYWAARDEDSGPPPRLDTPAAEGALAFLVALSQQALRRSPRELEESFLAGKLAFLTCDLACARRIQRQSPQFRLKLWPWPPEEAGGTKVALARTRSWEVPKESPQPQLANSLLKEFYSPQLAEAIGDSLGEWTPAVGSEGGGALDLTAEVRPLVHPWPTGEHAHLLSEALDRACDAALDRRRSPKAALAEAEAEFDSKADLSR
jgi:ABC-type glycerol-3-phosphate transport system substrate-binding protein